MKKGSFIVLEGIDGAGTTTQSLLLKERFLSAGHRVLLTKEPTDAPIGGLIRCALQKKTPFENISPAILALLYAADRLHHLESLIMPALDRGEIVISDRYVLSSLVYQGLDAPEAWVREVNRYAKQPDITLLVDIPLEESLKRVHTRGGIPEIFDEADVQKRLKERYMSLGQKEKVEVIEGMGSKEEVNKRLWDAIHRSLPLLT